MSANVSLLNSANSIQRLIQESLGRVHSPERSYSFHKNSLGGQIRPDEPPLLIGIVVPKVEARSSRLLERVGINQPSAFLPGGTGNRDIAATRLNREVNGHTNSSR